MIEKRNGVPTYAQELGFLYFPIDGYEKSDFLLDRVAFKCSFPLLSNSRYGYMTNASVRKGVQGAVLQTIAQNDYFRSLVDCLDSFDEVEAVLGGVLKKPDSLETEIKTIYENDSDNERALERLHTLMGVLGCETYSDFIHRIDPKHEKELDVANRNLDALRGEVANALECEFLVGVGVKSVQNREAAGRGYLVKSQEKSNEYAEIIDSSVSFTVASHLMSAAFGYFGCQKQISGGSKENLQSRLEGKFEAELAPRKQLFAVQVDDLEEARSVV